MLQGPVPLLGFARKVADMTYQRATENLEPRQITDGLRAKREGMRNVGNGFMLRTLLAGSEEYSRTEVPGSSTIQLRARLIHTRPSSTPRVHLELTKGWTLGDFKRERICGMPC